MSEKPPLTLPMQHIPSTFAPVPPVPVPDTPVQQLIDHVADRTTDIAT